MTAAAGDVRTDYNAKRAIYVLAGATATNGKPSGASAGVPCYPNEKLPSADSGACYTGSASREAAIFISNSAGSGTVAATVRLWGYLNATAKWYPIGAGSDATTKGTLNSGNSIGETDSDLILHCEPFYLMGMFDRLYAEVTAISGSSTAIDVWVVTTKQPQ